MTEKSAQVVEKLMGLLGKGKAVASKAGKRYGELLTGSKARMIAKSKPNFGHLSAQGKALEAEERKVLGTRIGTGAGLAGAMGINAMRDKEAAYRIGFEAACQRYGVTPDTLVKRAADPNPYSLQAYYAATANPSVPVQQTIGVPDYMKLRNYRNNPDRLPYVPPPSNDLYNHMAISTNAPSTNKVDRTVTSNEAPSYADGPLVDKQRKTK